MIDRLMFSTVLAGLCALAAMTALEASRIAPLEVTAVPLTAIEGHETTHARHQATGARLAAAPAASTELPAR
ncbi:MAG: hypothetical protein MUC74_02045 [Ideonella sp.]|jgi:predicted cobalt transporter CbtA|nr:hypothetical protein [Ideonella sp.]